MGSWERGLGGVRWEFDGLECGRGREDGEMEGGEVVGWWMLKGLGWDVKVCVDRRGGLDIYDAGMCWLGFSWCGIWW